MCYHTLPNEASASCMKSIDHVYGLKHLKLNLPAMACELKSIDHVYGLKHLKLNLPATACELGGFAAGKAVLVSLRQTM